jgi:hypothetical protein
MSLSCPICDLFASGFGDARTDCVISGGRTVEATMWACATGFSLYCHSGSLDNPTTGGFAFPAKMKGKGLQRGDTSD